MKIHRVLAEAVVKVTDEIFNENRYADKAIERILKSNRKWGARDRAFVAENTYDLVRWWRLLAIIGAGDEQPNKGVIWHALGVLFVKRGWPLPGWTEFRNLNEAEIRKQLNEQKFPRSIQQSIPDWLDQRGEEELGKAWDAELSALNQTAPVVIRVNTLRIQRDKLKQILLQEDIETNTDPEFPDALILKKRTNLFSLDAFQKGYFEVQDASSQCIAPFLQVEPGMRVVDACAGAGGKTLHLAALMQNKGRIIAMDTEMWKLDELMRRARRAGAGNIEPRLIDSTKVIKRLEASADRLLLDVPCSGLGVLRRNPDAKWKLKPAFIEQIRITQQEILSNYSTMLKPQGLMVYATCSILPSEDEAQVQTFLKTHPDFELRKEVRISATLGYDGFYMALLYRQQTPA
ncbi:MAG: RNA methyltransferase [Bacteroidia bacterium]|jgi:16S rRNA (cytosine967-C5)-methyltransferase